MSAIQQALLMMASAPLHSDVLLSLEFSGLSDGTSSFSDLSAYASTVTRLGNVVTAGGALSMDSSNTANGLSVPSFAGVSGIGTGDFTYEFVVTRSGTGSSPLVFGGSGSSHNFGYDASFGSLAFNLPSASGITGSGNPTWGTSKVHIGVMRVSGTFRLLYNGATYHNSSSNSGVSMTFGNPLYIGRGASTGSQFIGLIHRARLSKRAVYTVTSNTYTPPSLSLPFPDLT